MRDTFRHKIDILRSTEQDLGGGSKKKVYSLLHENVPGRLVEQRGVEEFKHGKKTVVSTHRYFTRYLRINPVTEEDIVTWTDPQTSEVHTFEVVRVKNFAALSIEMRLDLLENV